MILSRTHLYHSKTSTSDHTWTSSTSCLLIPTCPHLHTISGQTLTFTKTYHDLDLYHHLSSPPPLLPQPRLQLFTAVSTVTSTLPNSTPTPTTNDFNIYQMHTDFYLYNHLSSSPPVSHSLLSQHLQLLTVAYNNEDFAIHYGYDHSSTPPVPISNRTPSESHIAATTSSLGHHHCCTESRRRNDLPHGRRQSMLYPTS